MSAEALKVVPKKCILIQRSPFPHLLSFDLKSAQQDSVYVFNHPPQITWSWRSWAPITLLGFSFQWPYPVSLLGLSSSLDRWFYASCVSLTWLHEMLTFLLSGKACALFHPGVLVRNYLSGHNVFFSSSLLSRFAIGGQVVAVIGVFALDSKPLFHVSPCHHLLTQHMLLRFPCRVGGLESGW